MKLHSIIQINVSDLSREIYKCVYVCAGIHIGICPYTCTNVTNTDMYICMSVCIWTHTHACTHRVVSLELPFPLELKTQWSLLTVSSKNACEAGGVSSTELPFHYKIKGFHSSKAVKNISLCAAFSPETNWMNSRSLKGATCFTWSKIPQVHLIQEHPNTHPKQFSVYWQDIVWAAKWTYKISYYIVRRAIL